jgi:hypothetical protein
MYELPSPLKAGTAAFEGAGVPELPPWVIVGEPVEDKLTLVTTLVELELTVAVEVVALPMGVSPAGIDI